MDFFWSTIAGFIMLGVLVVGFVVVLVVILVVVITELGKRKTALPTYIQQYEQQMTRKYEHEGLMTMQYPRCWGPKHVMQRVREWRSGRLHIFGARLTLVDWLEICARCRWGCFHGRYEDKYPWISPLELEEFIENGYTLPSPYLYPRDYFDDLLAERAHNERTYP